MSMKLTMTIGEVIDNNGGMGTVRAATALGKVFMERTGCTAADAARSAGEFADIMPDKLPEVINNLENT